MTYGAAAGLTVAEVENIRAGKSIQAVKSIRERLGLGLQEAAAIVRAHPDYAMASAIPPGPSGLRAYFTPAHLRRMEALGWKPGSANPVSWLLAYAEKGGAS